MILSEKRGFYIFAFKKIWRKDRIAHPPPVDKVIPFVLFLSMSYSSQDQL